MQPFKQLSMNYHTIIQGLEPILYIEADVSFARRGKPVVIWMGGKSGFFKLEWPIIANAPITKAYNIHLNPPEAALTLTQTSSASLWYLQG